MLTGTIIYRTKHYADGTPYDAIFQVEGADTLASITTRISTHDYEAIGVMNGDPSMEELQLRRFNINTGTCKVETVKYIDENGKEKPRPVNNEFFVRLAATIRYAKTDVDLYLLTYIFRKLRSFFIDGCKHLIVKLRPTDQLCNGGSGFQKGTVQRFQKALYLCRSAYGCMFHSLDLFLYPALLFL